MYDLLNKIEGTDRLAQLFNAYCKGLSTHCVMCSPCYTTMAEVRGLKDGTLQKKEKRMLRHGVKNFYSLTVLGNSLRHIHEHILGAVALLEGFFTEHGDDLRGYATANRLRSINEYGSDDDTDWYRDNEADESEEWKISPKDDSESLKHYTLHRELAWHFGGEDVGRGEYVGTSGVEAFEPYTTLVANQSAFSFRKMFEGVAGQEVPISRLQPDGSLVPMTLGDHLEAELNEDLRSEKIVLGFKLAVGFCAVIREQWEAMSPDCVQTYRALHQMLLMVRDVDFPPEVVAQFVTPQ